MQQLSNQEAERLVRSGAEALRHGRPSEARSLFRRVTDTGRANAQIWLLLATACRQEGDPKGEEAALDSLLALEPRAIVGLILKADCRFDAGDEGAALGFYETAQLLAEGQDLPPDLRSQLQRVEARISGMKERLEIRREVALEAEGLPPWSRSPRFRQALDILAGRKRIYLQEPTGFYFPGLPQIQFYDPADFDWVPRIEAATSAIRRELEHLIEGRGTGDFRPYIESDSDRPRTDDNKLVDARDWSALFLCENGNISQEVVAQAPTAWEAVQAAPLPRISNSPTVMFSLLRGGARIAAHRGMFNTRLVCHLPLIVPPGCSFRVGNEIREWEEGKILIFDDSIEHEAWNDSDRDRVVLIFDIWRPELSEQERREVAAFFKGPAPA